MAITRRTFTRGAISAAVMTGPFAPSATGAGRFVVPAEEDRHQWTFMQWPVSRKVYGGGSFLVQVQKKIAEIANRIVDFEPVVMLAHRDDHAQARRFLSRSVQLWDIPTEDLWCRDSGPIVTRNDAGTHAISQIQFNGWGARQVHSRDGQVAKRVGEFLNIAMRPTGLKGEAGGVEQDGHGLLLAHESSWIHENRNPGQSRSKVETALLEAYGANQIYWSKGLKDMDITDYHIDALARFTGSGRVLICLPENGDSSDPFHVAAAQTYQMLRETGLAIDVIPEPVRRRNRSAEFVASYANYYVCNGAVIAQEYGDKRTDEIALETLARLYPSRQIVMMNADVIGELGGGIHCATHQMPA